MIHSLGQIAYTHTCEENIGNAPVMMKISTIKTFAGKQNENTVVVQISPNLLTLAHTNYTSPNYYQRYENKATQTNWWVIPFRWAGNVSNFFKVFLIPREKASLAEKIYFDKSLSFLFSLRQGKSGSDSG